MAIVGPIADQIAAHLGYVPHRTKRRPVGHRTFWCTVCDMPWPGVACPADPTHAGIKHGSEAEAMWYQGLLCEERAGVISKLAPHPVFTLPGGIRYTADAEYWQDGAHCVAEYKSTYTAKGREWRRTRRLFLASYPALRLVEVIE